MGNHAPLKGAPVQPSDTRSRERPQERPRSVPVRHAADEGGQGWEMGRIETREV